MTESESTEVTIGDKTYTVDREDVLGAFERTGPPSKRVYHKIVVEGEKKV
jgi:hypothetical protein